MSKLWKLRLLGGLQAEHSGRQVAHFRTRASGLLLAYLAHYGDRTHSREMLIDLFWPEATLDSGRHNLSMALSFLRRQLEPPGVAPGTVIVASRFWVCVCPEAVQTDVAEFERALHAAHATDGAERQRRLLAALDLYRGALLPGYFEDWVWQERARLADRFFGASQQAIAFFQQAGRDADALDLARRCVALEPEHPEGHALLTRLLLDAGRQPEATRQRRRLEKIMGGANMAQGTPARRSGASRKEPSEGMPAHP